MESKRILGINTKFQTLKFKNLDEFDFTDNVSFLDYDAVIISTNEIAAQYETESTFENRVVLTEFDSYKIQEDFQSKRKQIREMLNAGKNVFILMGINEPCYIYTGERKYSSSSKNARRTDIVHLFDTYSFLPTKIQVEHVFGDKVSLCCGQPYKDFFNEAEYAFYYAAYFTIPHSIPLLKITNTEKVISAVVEYRSGKLIFLPFPYLEDRYKDKKHWKLNGKIYLEEIFALNEKLTSSIEDFELPQWTREFSIFNEKDIYQKLDSEKKQLEEITNSIEESVIDIKNVQRYKLLVTATGAVLEEIVKKVLTELGLAIEESEKGRSDIIATYDGLDIVCEIKGVAKSAAEKHSAQLEKWAALFYSDFGRVPKSLLIVNSYCNLPIFEREEPAFPDQMLDYAVARKHCLLTTVQLLCLFIDVIQNPDLKEERIKELLNTVGIYNRYKDPNLFLLKN